MRTPIRGLLALGAGILALASAAPSRAAILEDCNDYASAGLIVEPWEQNTRTFYNGQVRVAVVDTDGEPAISASSHPNVLFWAFDADAPSFVPSKNTAPTRTRPTWAHIASTCACRPFNASS